MGSTGVSKASELLKPFTLGELELPNRMVLAPMTRGRAVPKNIPNDLMATYYVQRASAGLLITEGTFISKAANGWDNAPEIYSAEAVEGWKGVTSAVHAAGGRIFCQLWHCGRASHSLFREDRSRGVAPSPVAIRDEGGIHVPGGGKKPHEVPHELTVDEIKATVADYVHAAKNAMAAGMDGVEIHSANGYLLDSFLQTGSNKRTDAYGGSLENRFRFLREVVTAVTAVVPANKVGVRMSPNGIFNDQGSPDFREAFPYFASQLDSFGLAYLHVMDGLAFGFHKMGEPLTLADFRAVYHGTLMGNCGYTLEMGEKAVASGAADLVSYGRPWIVNPDLPRRFAEGLPLNAEVDMSTWYYGGEKGYTTYPTADEADAATKKASSVPQAEGAPAAAKIL